MTSNTYIDKVLIFYSSESVEDLGDWVKIYYAFYTDDKVRIMCEHIHGEEFVGTTTLNEIAESNKNMYFELPYGVNKTIESTLKYVTNLNEFIDTHYLLVKAVCSYT
jgi:hypothetical protein